MPNLPAPENKRFYPALDGLRALAVIMVFFEHYLAYRFPALNWGWAGVDVFFVLSGFLITGILYDTRNTAKHFRIFYARRTLRIFPLYYAVLLFGLLLTPLFHWRWNPAWYLWVVYLGNYARFIWVDSPLFPLGALEHLIARPSFDHYVPALYLGHFWSLCVEEQFYLLWPLVVYTIRDRKRLRNICAATIALTLAARVLCVFFVPQRYLEAGLLYRFTPLRIDALLIGGFIALCLRGEEAKQITQLCRPLLALFTVCFFTWEFLYWKLSGLHHLYYPVIDPVLMTIGYTLIDVFSAALVLFLLEPGSALFKVFTLKWPRRLGQMSYGFYVFHDMFHRSWIILADHFLRASGYSGGAVAICAFFSTLGLSYLSFRFFETPFLRLKDRFTP